MEVQPQLAPLLRSSGDLLADRRYAFAMSLAARGDAPAAIDVLAQAVEIAPNFSSAWFALGELRERTGDYPGAIRAYRCAQSTDPDDSHGANLRLVRLGAEQPGAMPTGYIRSLFDQYAPGFEAALGGLGYCGPELLLTAITTYCAQRRERLHFGKVLDLGCGTGLAGAAVRPLCKRLVGVDLAEAMVAQARRKGVYDQLVIADIATFLAAERVAAARYQLIPAADVLPYLYELTPFAAAAASLLDAGALLCLTAETHPGEGIVLGESLRYSHGEAHVRDAIAAAGLTLEVLERAAKRRESGIPVATLVIIARRP